jgi:hypothetical protein
MWNLVELFLFRKPTLWISLNLFGWVGFWISPYEKNVSGIYPGIVQINK